LASHRPASLRSDDLATRRLLGYLRSRRRGAGTLAQAAGDCRDSAIATALELHAGGDALRSVVEAYLLAAAPLSQIFARSGLPAAEIGAYHACFFDVWNRLARPDYIVRRVILAGASLSAAASPAEAAVKLAAYLGGPRVLAGILGIPRPQTEKLADVLPHIDQSNDGLVVFLKHVALLAQPAVSDKVALEGLVQRVRRQAATQRDDTLYEYERMVREILACAKFGPRSKPEDMPPEERPYFTGSGELRAHELMTWQQTGVPPGPEVLEQLHQKFPDLPARELGVAAGGASDA